MLGDITPAWRSLRRSPAFALTAVLTMATGVGAITGIFSVVNATLLRPLPVPEADRVVALRTVREDNAVAHHTVSLAELADWRAQSRSLAAIGAWRDWGSTRRDLPQPEPMMCAIATPGFFTVLGARAAIGRLFVEDEDVPGRNDALVLSDAYWRKRFGGRADVLGKTIVLAGRTVAPVTHRIVGVLPPEFGLPGFKDVEAWALSSVDPDATLGRNVRNRNALARLKSDATREQLQSEMSVIAERLAKQYPDTNRGWDVQVVPLLESDWVMGHQASALRAFLLAVGFVLLVACANVATLLLARAVSRRREFAVRQALGGARASVVRVLLTESVLLAAGGGVLGLALAGWLVRGLLEFGPAIPRADTVPFDAGVFLFTFAVCACSTILLALPAALLTTRLDLTTGLKEEASQVAHSPGRRFRLAIVGGEVALTLVLVAGALVATQTMGRLLALPLGFNPDGLAVAFVAPPGERYRSAEAKADLWARLIEEARQVPGVTGASAVSGGPLFDAGAESTTFTVEGRAAQTGNHPTARFFNAAPGYFHTVGIPLRAGRDFDRRDTRQSEPVTIVNEALVRRYLDGLQPIGTWLRMDFGGEPVKIVGVVADVIQELGPHATAVPEMYWPYAQQPRGATMLVVRGSGGLGGMRAVIGRVRAVDPAIQVGRPRFPRDHFEQSVQSPRFTMLLLALFAGIGLLLSAIGVYGLVAYSITQRIREIGVRMSLGATPRDLLRAIGTGGFGAVLAGTAAGLVGTWVVARLMSSMLPDLEPLRPTSVLLAAAVMVGVGLLACYVPVRRATRMDPASILRSQ